MVYDAVQLQTEWQAVRHYQMLPNVGFVVGCAAVLEGHVQDGVFLKMLVAI